MKTFIRHLLPLLAFSLLLSDSAQAWWNHEFTSRKKITVDTQAVSDPLGTSAVLIRLHDGDFQFSAAKDDGSDLRFIAADDQTPLAYQIEKYDSLLGVAFVWVKIPDLKPGTPTSLWLYYGNTSANPVPSGSNVEGTYDAGTELVYHFAESDGPAADSSGNGNNAANAGVSDDGSLIGSGLSLDGKHPVTIPASRSLAWLDGAALTWSAWINLSALQPNAVIFSRRDSGKSFLVGADNGVPFVEINGARSASGAPLAASSWHHVAVIAADGKITLYLDGAPYSTLNASLPALNSTALIGGDAPDAGTGTTGVLGELDELEISKVARPPGFIKFAALGQGEDSVKLVTVSQEEQPATGWLSGSLGLFNVILRSVTIDGWVVIGFLGVMSLVSWFVMVTKLSYLLTVARGNREFLNQWSHIASDLTALDHGNAESIKSLGGRLSPKALRLMRTAPLYKIYHIGAEEIGHRLTDPTHRGVLSAQSIQAIRASLDSGYVRQLQELNGGLVFLTISIAGGPFIGLFGTVAGVMITFAAIAATGEVNISSIAPGLAAALVATMAGLFVAIPALLGYNYLVSRIKNVSADLQIFMDEFVTKMAEFYRPDAGATANVDTQEFADQFVRKLIDIYLQRSEQTPPQPVPSPR